MKHSLITALFLACIVGSGFAQDLDWYYAQLSALETQLTGLQTQYNREKQTNDQRLMRIQQAKAKNDTQAAENELKDAYISAERLEQLNAKINAKQHELDKMCAEWSKVYGPTVDQLLADAEKNSNSKKRGEIGARLQKYQTLNSRLCVKTPNPISGEWRSLRIEPYDGPQEINQKVQLLKEISREMSIGISRLEQQYQQASREKLMRERAQEFVDEGTLFEGGVAIRSHAKGGSSVETDGSNTPLISGPDTKNPEPDEVSTGVIPMGAPWDLPATEEGYKKQRSELLKQQEELRNKITEFEEKEKALLKP
ncbi:MAG TPA: hypothetical protein VLH08_14770 [Acidobacteriota bacterium]|nr:hypothetical protein [Acidobacteriota bacterium]